MSTWRLTRRGVERFFIFDTLGYLHPAPGFLGDGGVILPEENDPRTRQRILLSVASMGRSAWVLKVDGAGQGQVETMVDCGMGIETIALGLCRR